MVVEDIPRCLKIFSELFSWDNGFQVHYSSAWHPNKSMDDPILDLGASTGVYIYSEPNYPQWNLPISANKNAIWYIGKSQSSVRARVWRNLGNMSEKDGSVCNPKFKYHRWANDETIKDIRVKEAIAQGDFVAYSIAIKPVSVRFAPEIVETFLLTCFYRSRGEIPVLNSLISQFKVPR